MSIVAPDPETSMRRGFPEPSPAASGKRKIAELAAAQMLAGVAATASTPMKQEPSLYAGDVTPPPHDAEPIIPPRRVGMGLSLQIVNPENLGITYDETRKRSRTGAPSPTTPWDGQLEQLVRYVPFWVFSFIDVELSVCHFSSFLTLFLLLFLTVIKR
jgi:hypothetical protein